MNLSLSTLNKRFRPESAYAPSNGSVRLLPFRFTRLDEERYVASSFGGEYAVLRRQDIEDLVHLRVGPDDPRYPHLRQRHFCLDDTTDVAVDLLAAQYRTRMAWLGELTGLHMFVVTLRCDHSCPYCQVSRVSSDKMAFDMSSDTAMAAVNRLFECPNPRVKVEFQGGESLLNFERITEIVEAVERRRAAQPKGIAYVIATNLASITDEMLAFCAQHGIFISTSLDGPAALHNANRPRPGGDSHGKAVAGIHRCREALGEDAVSALMTTTRRSLDQPEAIIDEYVRLGFRSIFLRWLSPFGFAVRTANAIGYPTEEWCRFYERGLRHTLRLAREGAPIREELAAIILRKILTPYPSGYVDLQSPAGIGISAIVYNYDGGVYASDEARMLAETGDTAFRLGNVRDNTYAELLSSPDFIDILSRTMTEATPQCVECAFEPYCGTDPVFHHATQGDAVGHRPTSAYCQRNMFVFRLLFRILEDEPENAEILRSWGMA